MYFQWKSFNGNFSRTTQYRNNFPVAYVPPFHRIVQKSAEEFFCDWSFALFIAPDVVTISIIVSSNKIQNGDVLVPAHPDGLRKMGVKWVICLPSTWNYLI